MNFFEFKSRIGEVPVFETNDLKLILGEEFNHPMLNNLKNWVNKGHLFMVRRGLYGFSESKNKVDVLSLAKKIYYPSYISLETALGYYGIIPEAVFTTTSITTRKTMFFKTGDFGNFSYQKIKRSAFGGFEIYRDKEGASFNLALPEKALVDFIYLNRDELDGSKKQWESYRFNEDFKYNSKRLVGFTKPFENKKVFQLADKFIKNYASR